MTASATGAEVWTQDSFEDFASGQLDAAGQNLYISHDGKIRPIHRFDVNQDGFIDLIFNSTHDTKTFVPATLGTVGSDGHLSSAALPVDGSVQVRLADLNRDGSMDAVFCPNDANTQETRRHLTILWGGQEGWSSRRSGTFLPVNAASGLAVADLNHDGWPDIAVLNGDAWFVGQPKGRILRIYWGAEAGYRLTDRREISVPTNSVQIAAGDWDGNGHEDLAVLTSDGDVHLFWEASSSGADESIRRSLLKLPGGEAACLAGGDIDKDGRLDLIVGTQSEALYIAARRSGQDWPIDRVSAFPASHVTIGDLDGDERADLMLCCFGLARAGGGEAAGALRAEESIRILWGSESGYASSSRSELPIAYATATAIGDMNGDGRADLLVAVHQTAETFAARSTLFLGRGNRRFEKAPSGFATEGAIDVAFATKEPPLPARVVFANSLGGTVAENVPLLLYWGARNGFSPQNVLKIPFRSGDQSTAADFDADGYVDLLAINSQHGGPGAKEDPSRGANIFWGSPEGFDFQKRRTVLAEAHLGTSNTADLNKDGYLDIVLGIFDPPEPDGPTPIVIYYGSKNGYRAEGRVAVPCEGRSIGTLLADLDRNGWLDIVVGSTYLDQIRIFWGGPKGFEETRQTKLSIPYPIDVEAADLNADGYLDLVAGSYWDPVEHHHDMGTIIFWGSPQGFRPWDAQKLGGWCPVGHCVADFDGDGHLDIFAPHYLGGSTREQVPSYLYWGGPEGFSSTRRTNFICDSAHDAIAADFDGDGRLDVAVSCHAKNGDHHTNSKVFYNDGNRFAKPRVVELPTHGTHWMWENDMGHIYHRRWEQAYESSIHALSVEARSATLDCAAETPPGTRLQFSVRAAPQKSQVASRPWQTVESAGFSLSAGDRFMQYRAVLRSDNGDRFPVLDRVTIQFQ